MSEPDDVVSFRNDRNPRGPARHRSARVADLPPGQPALFSSPHTCDFEIRQWGSYPKGFLRWALQQLECPPGEVLHVCSGTLPRGTGRLRIDIRREVRPDVVADGAKLPLRDQSVGGVLIDPPYSVEYSEQLYDTPYPRPSHLLAEAARVLKPCGRVGILHFLVPAAPLGCKLWAVRGVTTGCDYRIRAFTVFQREQDEMFPCG